MKKVSLSGLSQEPSEKTPAKMAEDVSTRLLCQSAAIAAVYVLLTLISPGELRFAECLCILPVFTVTAIPGLSVGCLLANIFIGASIIDIIFGTLATVIGACGTYFLRKYRWLMPLPPIIANTAIIPFVLKYAYGMTESMPVLFAMIGVSEIICVYLLGQLLYQVLYKNAHRIFGRA